MSKKDSILLGVNVDHVATLRQARGINYPDPVQMALIAEKNGADSITVHLREDRRHIQDHDVERLIAVIETRVNLEMAATEEMVDIACLLKPYDCCLVPEKRQELTTEGGLDVFSQREELAASIGRLKKSGIRVSLLLIPIQSKLNPVRWSVQMPSKFIPAFMLIALISLIRNMN